jgi:tRNA(adenine34) deaminase
MAKIFTEKDPLCSPYKVEQESEMDAYFMEMALEQARKALFQDEFPVGCVISEGNSVLVSGFRRGSSGEYPNEIDHAEINAIRELYIIEKPLKKEALSIYCTMEPCLMCFGAIILAGISKIVYAYEDVMGGGTGCNLGFLPDLYKQAKIKIVPHVLRRPSLELFKEFFSKPDNQYWKDSLLATYTKAQA